MINSLMYKIIFCKDLSHDEQEQFLKLIDKYIEGRSLNQLAHLLSFLYRPRQLTNVGSWHTGYDSKNKSAYRLFLKTLWVNIKDKTKTPIKLKWHNNKYLVVPIKSELANCLIVSGYYEPNEMLFLKKYLRKGMVFIDIGSHVGLYTSFASRLVGKHGKVIAFEPSSREYKILKENTKSDKDTVKTFKLAIGDKIGIDTLKLADEIHTGHNTLGNFIYSSTKAIREEEVKVMPLDALSKNWPKIDAIKIDVEGYENKVLMGAQETIRKFRPLIIIEISSESTAKLLAKNKYYLYAFNHVSGKLTGFTNIKISSETINIIASPERLITSNFNENSSSPN